MKFNENFSPGFCQMFIEQRFQHHSVLLLSFATGSPVPIPVLIPPNTFYHLDPGGQIPVINCYSECYPDCEMRWIKVDIQSTISTNGTLTLGKVQQNSSGEYSCHATWHGTDKTGRISVILLVKEDQGISVFTSPRVPVELT